MARSRKNKTVGCGCDYCMSRGYRRDFRNGGVDESDFEETDYTPRPRKKKGCKRSKSGEKCDLSKRVVKGSKRNKEGTGYVENYTRVCSRCGKEDWGYFFMVVADTG